MPSPTTPGTCTNCHRERTATGRPLMIFKSGKHKNLCHRCKWETSALKPATLTAPCQTCYRSRDRSGQPLRLHTGGKYKDMCLNCKKRAQTGSLPPEYLDPALRRYLQKRRARLNPPTKPRTPRHLITT